MKELRERATEDIRVEDMRDFCKKQQQKVANNEKKKAKKQSDDSDKMSGLHPKHLLCGPHIHQCIASEDFVRRPEHI